MSIDPSISFSPNALSINVQRQMIYETKQYVLVGSVYASLSVFLSIWSRRGSVGSVLDSRSEGRGFDPHREHAGFLSFGWDSKNRGPVSWLNMARKRSLTASGGSVA